MSTGTDTAGQPAGLRRALGPGMAIAMVVGNVIGSGIFLKPGAIAADSGDFRWILVAWLVGGFICTLGALCFAELAVMLPRAGGLYVYLREAYGRPVAFLFGWTEFLFGRPASIGALSVAFIGALAAAVFGDSGLSPTEEVGAALVVIAAMAAVNVAGVVWGGRVQAGTTIIKAGFLGVIALAPFVIASDGRIPLGENLMSTGEPRLGSFMTQMAAVMLSVMWAYNGWHGITPVAEEVRDPQRNIPLALFGGIGLLIALYVGANVAYHAVLPMEEVAKAGTDVPQVMSRTLLSSFGERAGAWGVSAISVVIMCSLFGAINSNLLNGPRIAFAMGRDGVFFRGLGMVHQRFHTPAAAIVVQAVMAALLVIVSAVLVAYSDAFASRTIFDMLTEYVVFSASLFYCLAVIAVFILRVRQPDRDRPYRTWGYPVVPVVYLAFYGWFLANIVLSNPRESGIGLFLILVGVPVHFLYRSVSESRSRSPQP